MKAAVITFPGSNCDDDLVYALRNVCEFEVTSLWHKDTPDLTGYDLVGIPGGFSYGDYLRCGAMASLSPIMENVKQYAANGGLVLGLCNGFQILCEAHLLPGALVRNLNRGFVCQDTELKAESSNSPWTNEMKVGEKITIPIAHGEGRYIVEDAVYQELKKKEQILFTYTQNPNGSMHDIAGICNESKNVFAMMPHPERASDLRTKDGMKIFKSIARYATERRA